MANLIPQIAEMLSVEINEEFKVDIYGDRIFKITESGVWEKKSGDDGYIWEEQLVVMRELLIGDIQMVKLPWKPKIYDIYWTFKAAHIDVWCITEARWMNNPNDVAAFKNGWVYRTQEEAKSALPKVAAELGVEYKL